MPLAGVWSPRLAGRLVPSQGFTAHALRRCPSAGNRGQRRVRSTTSGAGKGQDTQPSCLAGSTPAHRKAFHRKEPTMNKQFVKCPECNRVFDLSDEADAEEVAYGHDCEDE